MPATPHSPRIPTLPTDPAPDLKAFLKDAAGRTDAYLRRYLESLEDSPAQLNEAMAYSLLGSGKRIRPALVFLCHQAAGRQAGHASDAAAQAAAGAIEMIHCFSLIHDDLPAMDDDDLRRGRPTNHKVYGEALAILAGDGLNTLAFELLANQVAEPPLALALIRELSAATGPEGMIGGQVLDTCHPQEARRAEVQDAAKAGSPGGDAGTLGGELSKLQRIHRMKTGALIRCACRMGAICAGAAPDVLHAIDTYGRAIGLAFQIVDDILDVTATEEQMGKKTGKDSDKGKLTYPSLVGLAQSRAYLSEQVKIADDISRQLGARAVLLGQLAHDLANRTN